MFSLSVIGQYISHCDVQKVYHNVDLDEWIWARLECITTQHLEVQVLLLPMLSSKIVNITFPPCLSLSLIKQLWEFEALPSFFPSEYQVIVLPQLIWMPFTECPHPGLRLLEIVPSDRCLQLEGIIFCLVS